MMGFVHVMLTLLVSVLLLAEFAKAVVLVLAPWPRHEIMERAKRDAARSEQSGGRPFRIERGLAAVLFACAIAMLWSGLFVL